MKHLTARCGGSHASSHLYIIIVIIVVVSGRLRVAYARQEEVNREKQTGDIWPKSRRRIPSTYVVFFFFIFLQKCTRSVVKFIITYSYYTRNDDDDRWAYNNNNNNSRRSPPSLSRRRRRRRRRHIQLAVVRTVKRMRVSLPPVGTPRTGRICCNLNSPVFVFV